MQTQIESSLIELQSTGQAKELGYEPIGEPNAIFITRKLESLMGVKIEKIMPESAEAYVLGKRHRNVRYIGRDTFNSFSFPIQFYKRAE